MKNFTVTYSLEEDKLELKKEQEKPVQMDILNFRGGKL